jgi:hypothetical protein
VLGQKLVPDDTSASLVGFVKEIADPGSTIITDGWSSYLAPPAAQHPPGQLAGQAAESGRWTAGRSSRRTAYEAVKSPRSVLETDAVSSSVRNPRSKTGVVGNGLDAIALLDDELEVAGPEHDLVVAAREPNPHGHW